MSRNQPTASELFSPTGEAIAQRDPTYESQFFARVRLRNGTFKTTHPRRLDDLNRAIEPFLSHGRCLRLQDVAVSSGISTVEWCDSLRDIGVDFSVVATDACIDASLMSMGPFHVLCDSEGRAMQFELFGMSVQNSLGESAARVAARSLPISAARLMHQIMKRAAPGTEESCLRPTPALKRFGIRHRSIQLVGVHARKDPAIQMVEEDILIDGQESWYNHFDVVRVANILNHAYFPEHVLKAALRRLASRLALDGLLAICRTHDTGKNHASILRRHASGRLVVVNQLGDGSEVEHLATEIKLTPLAAAVAA